MLLIEHAFLHLYLQPGGHFEPEDEDTLAAARREIEEETGLTDANLTYTPLKSEQPLLPLDLEIQSIPDNPGKHETAHSHYDFRYLFVVDSESEVRLDAEESTTFRWTDWKVFAAGEPGFQRVAAKVERFELI